ncbi:ATP-dependent DNA helicase PIF1 [Glycine max]|nr:ATP-dependent DNA helicase PIF1 [Glycine max]
MMLTACKGPTSLEDLRTIANVQYPTYRETCFAMGSMNKPEEVWRQTWHWLVDGIEYHLRKSIGDADESNLLDYNTGELKSDFLHLFAALADQQTLIFNKIIQAVNKQEGGMFFLYGYGGTRKTFIWKKLVSSSREDKKIVLMVASRSIASLLLPGGRIAHSKFKILVPTFEDSTCNIHQGSELAKLLNEASLVIWDEAPMAHKFCFEALDKNRSSSDTIFGGKVIVLDGDFKQILPIIPRGSHSDIVHATINSSYLWNDHQVLILSKNMRLESNMQAAERKEIAIFAYWILDTGDGIIGHPNDVNELISNIVIGEHIEYLSSDSVEKSETIDSYHFSSLTTKFLNSLITSGLPNHSIKLKVGSPIMLLRNLDQSEGLCNRTRLIVTRLANHVIVAKIIFGKNIGNKNVYVSFSITMSLLRRQFPVMISYAMTINKSQD